MFDISENVSRAYVYSMNEWQMQGSPTERLVSNQNIRLLNNL